MNLAEGVEGEELPGEQPGLQESLRHQHDFSYQLKVWHHHGTGPGVGGEVGGSGYTVEGGMEEGGGGRGGGGGSGREGREDKIWKGRR